MSKQVVRVWDLPTRVFHWALVVLTAGVFTTGLIGGNLIVWHGRVGVAIGGLLAFRLAWGVVGSTYARFAQFVPGPGRIATYLRGQWKAPGHNPLGALSVLGLLGVMIFQVVSGLMANDDIAFEGPLYAMVSKSTSDWMSSLHRQNIWIVGGLITLHVLAILYYARVKKNNLVKPMITGVKEFSEPAPQSAQGGGLVSFVVAVAFAAATVWVATGGLLSPPPPPPAQAAPAW